jgi:MbtH protein
MTNPFDDESGEFCVLTNDEGQYSLWPTFKEIPAGWTSVGPVGARVDCLNYIEANWTDMRPKSLVEQMNKEAAARAAAQSSYDPINTRSE